MHRSPLIGITADRSSYSLDPKDEVIARYCRVVSEAGGLPVILPFVGNFSEYADRLDGWLIAGGDDIDPAEYGEQPVPEVEIISPIRFHFEKSFWPHFLPTGKPILGICYGCQFINVLSGGKLVQHLTDHRVEPKGPLPHALNLNPESMVAQACGGAQFEADSSHHQAIETLGEGLRVAGHAMDGTIEAIESANGRWLLGVQWHPERTPESPHTQALLRAFVEEAARSRK